MSRETHVFDVAVIGGGIVGMATALSLLQDRPQSVVVIEAEPDLASHQTGHNSGVVHSGIYYRPGSLKAKLCIEGRTALYRFCEEHGVPFERCGKVIVATDESELPRLAELERRAEVNGIRAVRLHSAAELRAREPFATGVGALLVEDTGIVDFGQVTRAMARIVRQHGGDIRTSAPVQHVSRDSCGFLLRASGNDIACRKLVNCAGLQSDRVARMCGMNDGVSIIPFRGEYMQLRQERRHLVRHLIYPVPDPDLPFLGQHFTRGLDGTVEVGPNAVLATARHGYKRRDISARDLASMATFPGFWRMARRHWRTGLGEAHRSLKLSRSIAALRRLIPSLSQEDLEPGRSGVRAQAVASDGRLLDDFHLVVGDGMLHVLNAPSPAATASLAIGRRLAQQVSEMLRPSRSGRVQLA
jgi:(S)-2-hydroxyglutarate dehydrogenase